MPDNRQCSKCGAKSSALSTKKANGRRYPQWHLDGNGGHLCKSCYDKRKRERKKAIAGSVKNQDKA
jgi:hypothetical protein